MPDHPLIKNLMLLRMGPARAVPAWDWLAAPGGLRHTLRAIAQSDDYGAAALMLDDSWALLADGGALTAIEVCVKDAPAERVWKHACALVAACQATVALRQGVELSAPDAFDRFRRWWVRCTEKLGEETASLDWKGYAWQLPVVDARELLLRTHARLAAGGNACWKTLLWVLDCLHGRDTTQPGSPFTYCHDAEKTAYVGRLHVRKPEVDPPPGVLIEHPAGALQPIDHTWLDAVGRAFRTTPGARSLLWWATVDDRSDHRRLALEGNSAGGAAALAFLYASQGLEPDAGTLVAASLEPDGSFVSVGHEEEKVRVFLATPRAKRVVLAESSVLKHVPEFRDDHRIVTAANAAEAGDFIALLTFVASEDRWVRQNADDFSSGLPRGSWDERAEQLYIPVNVLCDGVRHPWAEVFKEWDGPCRKELLVRLVEAEPGAGKSALLRYVVFTRTREAIEQWNAGFISAGDVHFAVFLRAPEVAAAMKEATTFPDAAVVLLLARHAAANRPGLAKLLRQSMDEGRCLIALDALDEVPANLREDLMDSLAQFVRDSSQARMLLSSRPGVYKKHSNLIDPKFGIHAIQDFDQAQVEQALQAWLSADPEAAEAIRLRVTSNPGIAAALCNPLRLTMACAITRRDSSWKTVSDLYAEFMRQLYDRWCSRADTDAPLAERDFLEMIRELACHTSTWENPSGGRPEIQAGIRAILAEHESKRITLGKSLVDYLRGRPDPAADLCAAGILVYDGDRFIFWHATIRMYLAALSLGSHLRAAANQKDLAGQREYWNLVEAFAWDPFGEELVLFLAGELGRDSHLARELLRRLADTAKDDLLAHRLILAGLCLVELPKDTRLELKAQVDEITTLIVELWIWSHRQPSDRYFHHLARAVQGLAVAGGCLVEKTEASLPLYKFHHPDPKRRPARIWTGKVPFLDWVAAILEERMEDGFTIHITNVLYLLNLLGPTVMPNVADPLVAMLQSDAPGVRARAFSIIAHYPPACSEKRVTDALIALLSSPDAPTAIGSAWTAINLYRAPDARLKAMAVLKPRIIQENEPDPNIRQICTWALGCLSKTLSWHLKLRYPLDDNHDLLSPFVDVWKNDDSLYVRMEALDPVYCFSAQSFGRIADCLKPRPEGRWTRPLTPYDQHAMDLYAFDHWYHRNTPAPDRDIGFANYNRHREQLFDAAVAICAYGFDPPRDVHPRQYWALPLYYGPGKSVSLWRRPAATYAWLKYCLKHKVVDLNHDDLRRILFENNEHLGNEKHFIDGAVEVIRVDTKAKRFHSGIGNFLQLAAEKKELPAGAIMNLFNRMIASGLEKEILTTLSPALVVLDIEQDYRIVCRDGAWTALGLKTLTKSSAQ